MKTLIFISIILLASLTLSVRGQVNIENVGNLNVSAMHSTESNDIWGWVDTLENEYAIVGLNDGTSIVDVTNPDSLKEVFFEPGQNSKWRDIKTWKSYAYITTEAVDGLLIIDLSTLPGDTVLSVNYYTGDTTVNWESAHNIFIDENGIAYIFGGNQPGKGKGDVIMLDVDANPTQPPVVGVVKCPYAHDGVARGDTLYLAHAYEGTFSIWNVLDKQNSIKLAEHKTDGKTCHNIWFSDDGKFVYTTDEIGNGFIEEYDISDYSDIKQTDKIQSSPGDYVIPHNTHFIDNYLVTSYYHDGITIHDVSSKGNMVEVGRYDTDTNASGTGYSGCWGVYPWLPSGNIIASDEWNGLYVFKPNYKRAAVLEAKVTELGSGAPLGNIIAEIVGTPVNSKSDLLGQCKMGYHDSGSYSILFKGPLHYPKTLQNVKLTNGQITTLEVELEKMSTSDISIKVVDGDGNPIDNAQVYLLSEQGASYDFETNTNGMSLASKVVSGSYEISVGAWGWIGMCVTHSVKDQDEILEFKLENKGYQDDFSLDLGWVSSGTAKEGRWERGVPNGTTDREDTANPFLDVVDDCLGWAYVTGNKGVTSDDDDVEYDKMVTLTSPAMDLATYTKPILNFAQWQYIQFGRSTVELIVDSLGVEESFKIQKVKGLNSKWTLNSIDVRKHVLDANSIKFRVSLEGGNSVNELGLDGFSVTEGSDVVVPEEEYSAMEISVYPNPFSHSFAVQFAGMEVNDQLIVWDCSGRLVDQIRVDKSSGVVNLGKGIPAGMYLVGTRKFGTFAKVAKL